ncbi:MAG: porin [Gemmatimonadaceae bacterium]
MRICIWTAAVVAIAALPRAAVHAQSATTQATSDSAKLQGTVAEPSHQPVAHQPVVPRGASPKKEAWYDKISLRGYAQVRYNRLLETNKDYTCPQCDKSIGDNGGIFLRRARLVFSGDVSKRVSIYIQPDYASDAAGSLHYLQIKDAYFDLWLDGKKEHRIRIGQSKIPFGFENLQSSSNRLPLDRNDGLNSGTANERDMGALYYWAPTSVRRTLKMLTDSGLKGTGDYGLIGLGVFNGQTANKPEANNSLHKVARITYPFRLPNGQFVEMGVSGYTGRFVLTSQTAGVQANPEYKDERVALSFLMYAQPLGLEAEWNWGTGPSYDLATRSVASKSLQGGFLQSMYRWRRQGQVVQPFVRWQYYAGGKKLELDARRYEVHELEGGIEWLPTSALELTVDYVRGNRVTADGASLLLNRQKGGFLRLQAQVNY